jgi:flagellar hook-associated protein 2
MKDNPMVSIANSLGYGSGIDVASLVTQLAAASREPKVARFDTRTKAVQSSISAVAQARSDLESFSTSLATLVAGGTLQSQPTVADTSILEAKAVIGARLTSFSGAVEVTQLARGQTLASAFKPSAASAVGLGAITLTVGATPYAITIGTANDSLTGLASAINDARTGVTASVVNDTAGARLVLRGPTGTPSAFTVASSDPGLSNFAYPGSMALVQSALNAEFNVDGLAYSRPTNTIDDVVPGVSLTLKKISLGTPVSIGVTRATDSLKTTITDFVSVYNELKGHIAAARTATRGDQAMRTLDRQLSQLIAQPVTSGTPESLAAIGIKTNRDGTIAFDESVFATAYSSNPDAVEAIFSPTRDATHTATTDPGIGGALSALKTAATASTGALASLSTRLGKEATALATDRERMEVREMAYKARLEKQFASVDSSIGALKATQSYLDQQIKLWTASK